MILLTDIDIFRKVANCDLLDEALIALKAEKADLRVLNTLKYRLRREEKQGRIDPIVLNRIKGFLAGIHEVRAFSQDVVTRLEGVDGVGGGEAILLAVAVQEPDSIILTGDKRFVMSLANKIEILDLARQVEGRIVCFEQIIRRCIQSLGFNRVRSKVVANRNINYDTALCAAFGSGSLATESETLACLHSYIQELRRQPIDLLQPDLVEGDSTLPSNA